MTGRAGCRRPCQTSKSSKVPSALLGQLWTLWKNQLGQLWVGLFARPSFSFHTFGTRRENGLPRIWHEEEVQWKMRKIHWNENLWSCKGYRGVVAKHMLQNNITLEYGWDCEMIEQSNPRASESIINDRSLPLDQFATATGTLFAPWKEYHYQKWRGACIYRWRKTPLCEACFWHAAFLWKKVVLKSFLLEIRRRQCCVKTWVIKCWCGKLKMTQKWLSDSKTMNL